MYAVLAVLKECDELLFFFFQAEDGIRDSSVTGVQTCALPIFEQALLDALREDPDVVMVGEMRDPETMRLTLSASETGHLVLTTVHSSTCAEALQRIVSSFAPDIQGAVRAQLADCLVGVICQRLRYRPDLKIRVPECEILLPTMAVKNFIRTGDFFKICAPLEMRAAHQLRSSPPYHTSLATKECSPF